jgi:methyltransferase (TIGR00027 family)
MPDKTSDNLIENVSDTAFWIAHHRAVETARPDALFHDPLAGLLAGERGRKIAGAMPISSITGWHVAIRTRIIDDYIKSAIEQGIDTILNLGAGLDTRPYRIDLPPSLLWIEADYPAMIEFKEARLANEKPRCGLERVKVDLSVAAERRQMLGAVNARAKQLLVLTEGVITYLDPVEVGALADDLRTLNHLVYWIVDYFSPDLVKFRERSGMQRKLQNAPFKFHPPDWFGFFALHGWRPKETRYIPEEAERLHRRIPLPPLGKIIFPIRMFFASKKRREAMRKFSGYVLLEPVTLPSRETFQTIYQGNAPPWNIGKVQPAFAAAAVKVAGSLVDVGCGTGENALFFAAKGHAVTGVDFLEAPIAAATQKAAQRGVAATFLVKDALTLRDWPERFDTAIDSGLFHVFSNEDRARYVEGLKTILRPGGRLLLLCFSDETPGTIGPRRVSQAELRAAFAQWWQIESIEPSRFETRPESRQMFAGEDPRAWFLIANRLA